MDSLETYRKIIEDILLKYTNIKYAFGDIKTEAIFDYQRDRYLVVDIGWNKDERIHDVIVHLEIINGKIWIQGDNTEEGVALDLEKAGVPKDKIVLGFKSEFLRQFTDYAAA